MLGQTPRERRRQLIEPSNKELSLRQQCDLLQINRSTIYYKAHGADVDDVSMLNEIRDVWERYPFYGYRRITKELQFKGFNVNRKRIQRLMKMGGIQAIYPGPNTSRRNKLHAVYPYLLKEIPITQVNQAWMVDITYLRLESGFVYLVALIDIHSRFVLSWKISTTLETIFCVDALKLGLEIGIPEIINSDQGCQFTSDEWTDFLKEHKIKISMTGKGRCLDNVYIERFWRSVKREEFYLNEYATIKDLKKAIGEYIEFYNYRRWHQSLDYKTPASIYYNEVPAAVVGF
ncbi:MAG: IS3 family transposase [Tatlockia sp.]|nr:IS3 family transposase [Tatlockia sp.]